MTPITLVQAPELERKLRSLGHGNRVRVARVEAAAAVKAGRLEPAAIVDEPPWYAETWTVLGFLEAMPGIGARRLRHFNARALRIGELNLLAPLGEITDRQRGWLLGELPHLLRPHRARGR